MRRHAHPRRAVTRPLRIRLRPQGIIGLILALGILLGFVATTEPASATDVCPICVTGAHNGASGTGWLGTYQVTGTDGMSSSNAYCVEAWKAYPTQPLSPAEVLEFGMSDDMADPLRDSLPRTSSSCT